MPRATSSRRRGARTARADRRGAARLSQLPQGELKSQLLTDVARLGNVAEHLLDLQRLDRNVGALQRLDLAQLVREAAADLAPLVVGAGYGFEVDAPEAPVWIHGDSLALGG